MALAAARCMVRLVAFALAVTACTTSDDPTLELAVGADGTLQITFARGPDHVFATLAATANGVDLGTPVVAAGGPGQPGAAAVRATATFATAIAPLGPDVHVEVIEGDDLYTIDVPGLGITRVASLSLDVPLAAGQWIGVADGVNDELEGGFALTSGAQTCTVQFATRSDAARLELQLSANLTRDWWCTPMPTPGELVPVHLGVDLTPRAVATACSGRSLGCAPIELPALHVDMDVSVQF
jgi:hypothetical protein